MAAQDDDHAGAPGADASKPALFLSYASEDRQAAIRLRDALLGLGIEVWYDESELGGGEAWDQKIRKQIRECDFFMPMVSAQTEARLEGYFRREWRLAVERTQDMADDHLFLLPVVIDASDQATARVPEKFLSVQWLKLPGGQPNAALEALCRRILSGETTAPPAARDSRARRRAQRGAVAGPAFPAFPALPAGNRLGSARAALGWAARSTHVAFMRLPRWIRFLVVVWLMVAILERGCADRSPEPPAIPPAAVEKLKTLAQQDHGNAGKVEIAQQAAQFVRELAKDDPADATGGAALLAIPFTAPAGSGNAARLADAAFTSVFGKLSLARHGDVALAKEPLASSELGAALERGLSLHATYVLYGSVEKAAQAPVLAIRIASVKGRSITWSKSYPVQGADTAAIATEVAARVPALGE
jgi:TolB-like protein